MSQRNIDIFDFDGTLVSINSFHLFLLFLGILSLVRLRLATLRDLAAVILARLGNKISHLELKTNVNTLGLSLTHAEVRIFFKLLSFFRQETVFGALKDSYASTERWCVIASAAPYAYMRYASLEFPVDLVVSFGGPGNLTSMSVDNTGNNKIVNVSAHLDVSISRLNLVYTDHIDDLPLALIADNLFVVNPDKVFVDALLERSVKFTLI